MALDSAVRQVLWGVQCFGHPMVTGADEHLAGERGARTRGMRRHNRVDGNGYGLRLYMSGRVDTRVKHSTKNPLDRAEFDGGIDVAEGRS